ncbi:ankyrin repeat domain-containing protein [Catenovulum sp. SX2]|uniref:ankyrin repeat domain-containing protein n=1 Tax=Catenovulum sp. SX2 TaxID=3398614 RepID=UPI003F85EF30
MPKELKTFLLLSFTLVPCMYSFSGFAAVNPACKSLPSMPMPEWIFNPTVGEQTLLYGHGVTSGAGNMLSISQLRRISRLEAQRELAETLEVSVRSELVMQQAVTKTEEINSMRTSVNDTVKASSDVLLQKVKVEAIWLNHETCNLWTRVSMRQSDFNQSQQQVSAKVMLALKQLTAINEKVDTISSAITQDPNTLLRKYNLRLDAVGYLRALQLEMPEKEWYPLLDLYQQNNFVLAMNATYHFYQTDMLRLQRQYAFYLANSPAMSLLHYLTLDGLVAPHQLEEILNWAQSRSQNLHVTADTITANVYSGMSCNGSGCYSGDLLRFKNEFDKGVDSYLPIHVAAIGGRVEVMEKLLQVGFSANVKTNKGYTPLALAIDANNTSMVSFLLAKPESVENDMGAALEVAVFSAFRGLDKSLSLVESSKNDFAQVFAKQVEQSTNTVRTILSMQNASKVLVERFSDSLNATLARCNKQLGVNSSICNQATQAYQQLLVLLNTQTH